MVATKNRVSASRETTAKKRASNGAQEAERIVIPLPDLRTFKVKVVGKTPLIIHRFSEKSQRQIEEAQGQKAAKPRGKRDPKAEYLGACYVFPGHEAGKRGCVYGIKADMPKASIVSACRFVNGIPMTVARGALHVLADEAGLVRLKFRKMQMDTDCVVLKNGSKDMRYRPEFIGWSVILAIEYNAGCISAQQIVGLLGNAGFSCGWGEKRPGSKTGPGGSNGTFGVETA